VPTEQTSTDQESASEPTPDSPFRARGPVDDGVALALLATGDLTLLGQMPWSSNGTFLVDLAPPTPGDNIVQGVYKPGRGERPLRDFPAGLYRREAAAWELASHLGWGLIPPTVVRDGPLGEGSVQLYVPCDYREHYFTLCEDPTRADELRRLAVFDLVANNTDRKAGHVLAGDDGRIWAVDNALCFHQQFKIRTVIWDFSGQPIPAALLEDLTRLVDTDLPTSLSCLLDTFEAEAIVARASALLADGELPVDPSGRRVPWPLL
jgi:uncharacterized repeat protein (TIGR03843 family)|tara:strand:- start:26870 stop:27661 length:792 start_codon:yes stop_codon:yes gene_type:complete